MRGRDWQADLLSHNSRLGVATAGAIVKKLVWVECVYPRKTDLGKYSVGT